MSKKGLTRLLDLMASMTLIGLAGAASVLEVASNDLAGEVRVKRADEVTGEPESSSGSPEMTSEAPSKATPISLGEILGLLFLVCCIIYCIGIGYKIVKIIKGTYVEEEPVFMKYK